MSEFRIEEEMRDNGEWIRPSPTKEKALKIAAWFTVILASVLFIGMGIWLCIPREGERANPKSALLIFAPLGFWAMLLLDEPPPIRGVRIALGDALQVEIDDGQIVTIAYGKLAKEVPQIERAREKGRYFSPRTDGCYVSWRGGSGLSRHDIGRLGVGGRALAHSPESNPD